MVFAVIFGRLFYLQIIQGSKLLAQAKRFQQTASKPKYRGDIVDRYNKVLALDVNKYSLEFIPSKTIKEDRQKLARKLSRIISVDTRAITRNKYKTLARDLDREEANKIRALNSRLLKLNKSVVRYYPQQNLASHLLGYVDLYGVARQGLEAKYEENLVSSPNGSLKLSIDSRLQALAEKALSEQITKTKAKRGTVMVMKVNTGELLTWAVQPNYNPNRYFKEPMKHIKNWALTDVYQPGSIFKIVTVSSALASDTIGPEYTFTDEGFIKVDGWKIRNHGYNPKTTKAEVLDLKGLFANSSNPFAAHLGLEMGPDVFYDYIKLFGFGERTGIEAQGETQGIVRKPSTWRNSDAASTGIGQGAISVTPLQVLTAINTVANNGVKIKPTLIKRPNGRVDSNSQSRVISPETAQLVSSLLTRSVAYNIKNKYAQAGKVPGLRVAGKTGTAEKAKSGGGYHSYKTVASFIGFFPAHSPRYIALVVIDDPETDGRWGDTVAGPLFNKIAEFCKNLYLG